MKMEQLNELALFAGAGGGILGGKLLGWRTVCAVERDAYAAAVLAQRQNDGILEPFPIWSDVSTFHGEPWHGIVDVVSGGFPCQDISAAGKGAGITGSRSGLWKQMARIIREVGPRFVYVENSPMLTSRGLDVVLGDLASLGFDAEWGVLSAASVGAPHKRERIWIIAYSSCIALHAQRTKPIARRQAWTANGGDDVANSECTKWRPEGATRCGDQGRIDADRLQKWQENAGRAGAGCDLVSYSTRLQQGRQIERTERQRARESGESIDAADTEKQHGSGLQQKASELGRICKDVSDSLRSGFSTSWKQECQALNAAQEDYGYARRESWWQSEPDVGRVAHGVAARVDRLKAIGNGQVSLVAATAFRKLLERTERS